MHSYVYQTLSLTTITVLSLATSNGLNANAGDVVQVQSLMNSPPGSQGQLDDPNIGFDMKNEIEGWGGVADTNNARTGQPFLAESNDHGCARTNKRRRGNTDYCSPKDAPLQFRPSSQQEDPQPGSSTVKTDGSATGPGQQPNPNTQTDGENLLAPDDNKKNNCPARYKIPICATSKLEPDPAQEGGWRREPWDEIAAADVIFQQDFCRLCSLIQTLPLHSQISSHITNKSTAQGILTIAVMQNSELSVSCAVDP